MLSGGFEPPIRPYQRRSLPISLQERLYYYKGDNGAGEEVRTLDIYLGKVMLYQLSYARSVKLFIYTSGSAEIFLVPSVGFEPTAYYFGSRSEIRTQKHDILSIAGIPIPINRPYIIFPKTYCHIVHGSKSQRLTHQIYILLNFWFVHILLDLEVHANTI